MVTATLNAWATSMGIDQQTLERRIVKAGFIKPKAGWGKVAFKKIYIAMIGDKEAEQVRALQLENAERERDAEERNGSLVPIRELEPWILQHYIVPMSNVLASAPTELDTRCNPQQPAVARKAINDWIENEVKPKLNRAIKQS